MSERATPDYQALKARVRELAKGPADRAAVEAKLRKLSQEGIPKRVLNRDEIVAHKQEILEQVNDLRIDSHLTIPEQISLIAILNELDISKVGYHRHQ